MVSRMAKTWVQRSRIVQKSKKFSAFRSSKEKSRLLNTGAKKGGIGASSANGCQDRQVSWRRNEGVGEINWMRP